MFDAESTHSVRERPDNPDASTCFVEVGMARGDPPTSAEAIALSGHALRSDPMSVRAMCSLADEAINSFVIT